MIRRPPRSTQSRSSAASDVYKRQVEGHTDNVPYGKRGELLDNWDLSVKRATAIVRELQNLGVAPSRLVAAGRSEYVPLVPNTTAENKATNRRTRILVLPKIDQFYDICLLYTSPSPRDRTRSRMPSSA
eukprot:TRINITY_DN2003_c0_g1_i1.p1 TRINITY_DN2003_c0_g1~~TRINITY_DN2003_c0_g1_i1.p1  ORF type:complete len:129 (-),score=28.52 TRINITY_DN2003_c0_g1_i1:135-521(-)